MYLRATWKIFYKTWGFIFSFNKLVSVNDDRFIDDWPSSRNAAKSAVEIYLNLSEKKLWQFQFYWFGICKDLVYLHLFEFSHNPADAGITRSLPKEYAPFKSFFFFYQNLGIPNFNSFTLNLQRMHVHT